MNFFYAQANENELEILTDFFSKFFHAAALLQIVFFLTKINGCSLFDLIFCYHSLYYSFICIYLREMRFSNSKTRIID